MKQNERLLVYAVTGFLALILLVAVVFGRAPENKTTTKTGGSAQPLADVVPGLNGANGGAGVANAAGGTPAVTPSVGGATPNGATPNNASPKVGGSGLPGPGQLVAEQPLMAQPKPMVAADLVAQSLGLSRRERNVRFVRAKSGDSLDTLVRRWCGARDPFLAEAQSLNEELQVLRVGQEVALPWVEDEVLAAGLEQQKPKAVLANDPIDVGRLAAEAAERRSNGTGTQPAVSQGTPVTPEPKPLGGNSPASSPASSPANSPASAVATTPYVVKKGDALWRIAERTYGRKNADRMVGEIKAVNPGMSDNVREGQKILLPKVEAAPKADVASKP